MTKDTFLEKVITEYIYISNGRSLPTEHEVVQQFLTNCEATGKVPEFTAAVLNNYLNPDR